MMNQPKYVASLTFRGFKMSPEEVEALIGRAATELGRVGTPRRQGLRPLTASFATWEFQFDDNARYKEMLPTLFENLGGASHLALVKQVVMPEHLDVDITMWIKDSKVVENGVIEVASLAMLTHIGAGLGLSFYERNPA